MKRVLVTGATGFLGWSLVDQFAADGRFSVRAASRQEEAVWSGRVEAVRVGDMGADTEWSAAVKGTAVVIHAAARVHVLNESAHDPLAEFRRVNVSGTLKLAREAAQLGVPRFIFLSSIKVNGEETHPGRPFRVDDTPAPSDAYGLSKQEAEEGLRRLAAETGMEVVIIRPPLVYGPRVRANFFAMMRWLDRGIPLPFGAIQNRRSLLALDNLVDLILTCTEHPAAANQTFLAADGEDLSTTALLRRLGHALGVPARLVPVPAAILRAGAGVFGKQAIAERLCGSLQVDISKTQSVLGWKPPVDVDEGLARTVEWYRATRGGRA